MKTKGLSKRKKTVSRISSEVLASPYSAEVVVVGGGASGVFVSILLAKKGYDVLCVEKRDQLLKKVAATGNGRCNFTNASLSDAAHWEEVYTGTESDFVRPALEGCDDQRIRQIFLDWGMPSRVFPSGMVYPLTLQAQTVCERLTLLAHEAGVRFALNAEVQYLEALSSKKSADKTAPRYLLQGIQRGEEQENKFTLKAKALILATGGCFGIGKNEISNGHALLQQLGVSVTSMHPSICGICVQDAAWTRPLKGLKVNARCFVPSTGHSREEDVLFTEYGLSGLAVLFLSNDLMDAYAKMQTAKSFSSQQRQRVALHVDFLPSMREEDLLFYAQNQMKRYPDRRLEDLFSGILPRALVHQLLLDVSKTKPWPRDKKTSVEKFVAACKNKVFYTQGARSEETGQVTCGGALCAEFDAHTMQHQSKEHLYALGEVLNVQGICGGYNLHWAWASAHALADHFSL